MTVELEIPVRFNLAKLPPVLEGTTITGLRMIADDPRIPERWRSGWRACSGPAEWTVSLPLAGR